MPIEDCIYEPSGETVVLRVKVPGDGYVAGSPSSATLTITDNDSLPTITVAHPPTGDWSGSEGSSASFSAVLSCMGQTPVSFDFQTEPGTAVSDGDYKDFNANNGTVTFTPTMGPPSNIGLPVTLGLGTTTINDSWDELDEEVFYFTFFNVVGPATLATTQRTATIIDNDGPPGINIDNVSVTETDEGTTIAKFTVSGCQKTGHL
jgi:hypothetical protein